MSCHNGNCCTADGCNNNAEYKQLPVAYGSGTKMENIPLCHWCYEKLIVRYFREIRDSQALFDNKANVVQPRYQRH